MENRLAVVIEKQKNKYSSHIKKKFLIKNFKIYLPDGCPVFKNIHFS